MTVMHLLLLRSCSICIRSAQRTWTFIEPRVYTLTDKMSQERIILAYFGSKLLAMEWIL